ncbi:MAG: hypothetical protein ACXVCP_19550 [Bdellovibrio sp.]
MQLWVITLFFFLLGTFSVATPPQASNNNKNSASLSKLYQINLAALTPLYDISDPNNVKQIKGQSFQFTGMEMVKAEEIRSNGHRYLKIPYVKNSQPVENKFYLLEFGTPSVDGKYGVTYEPTLSGDSHELISSLLGKKDHFLYLDRSVGTAVSLTNEPGQKPQEDCEGNRCLDSKNQLRVLDSRIAEYTDPFSNKTKRQIYYKVTTWICPKSNLRARPTDPKPLCADQYGWIPAKDTIDFQREDSLEQDEIGSKLKAIKQNNSKSKNIKEPTCAPGAKNNLTSANKEVMKAVSSETEGLGTCVFDEELQKNLNKLLEDPTKGASKKNKDSSANTKTIKKTPFDVTLRDHWANSKAENKEHLFAIDAMARSLFGEMRGCTKNSTGYIKLIARVFINRSLAVNHNRGQIEGFLSPLGSNDFENNLTLDEKYQIPLPRALPHILSSPGQVSSFNSDDPNLKVNLCPKAGMLANSDEEEAWQKCVEVATEAVLKPKKLIQETPNIDALYYSSEVDEGKPPQFAIDYKMSRMDNFIVKNEKNQPTKLHNPKCLVMWRTQPVENNTRIIATNKKDVTSNVIKLNFYQEKLKNPIASNLIK